MKSLPVAAVFLLFCASLGAQSLTQLAKTEKERRKKNSEAGVAVKVHTNSDSEDPADEYDYTGSGKTMEEYEAEMQSILAELGPLGEEAADHVARCTAVVTTSSSTETGEYVGTGVGSGTSRSSVTDDHGNTVGYVDGTSNSTTREYGQSSKTRTTTSVEHRWNEGCAAQERIITSKLDRIVYKYDALYTAYKKDAIEQGKLLQVVPRDGRLPTAAERRAGAKVSLEKLSP